jgi:hypothetical protein
VSADDPETASVTIGALGYRARCIEPACVNLARLGCATPTPAADRLITGFCATRMPGRGWRAIERRGSRFTTIAPSGKSALFALNAGLVLQITYFAGFL